MFHHYIFEGTVVDLTCGAGNCIVDEKCLVQGAGHDVVLMSMLFCILHLSCSVCVCEGARLPPMVRR